MQKRTTNIEFRTTPEEKARFEKMAKQCGLSKSAFFRMLANGYEPKPLPPIPFTDCARVLSNLYNAFRERGDPDAADKILQLVKLMTESFSPEKGVNCGNDKNMEST